MIKNHKKVNRGFVGLDHMNPKMRLSGQPEFEHRISGILRGPDGSKPLQKRNDLVKDLEFLTCKDRNIEEFATASGSLPIMIDLDNEAAHPDGPIAGQIKMTLPNNHAAYMIQWWALTLGISIWLYRDIFL